MNLFEAAAKAAGDIAPIWAENTIRADIQAKRDARLRQHQVEDREDRQAFQTSLADTQFERQQTLADKEWSRRQALSDKEWERTQGAVADTTTIGDQVFKVTGSGDYIPVDNPNITAALETARERASATDRLEHYRALEVELMKNRPDAEYATAEALEQWKADLEEVRLHKRMASTSDPNKRADLLEQSKVAAESSNAIPRIQAAKTKGTDKQTVVNQYRQGGHEYLARAIEKYWDDVPGPEKKAAPESQQRPDMPASDEPGYDRLDTTARREVAEREKAAEREQTERLEAAANRPIQARENRRRNYRIYEPQISALAEDLARAPIHPETLSRLEAFQEVIYANADLLSSKYMKHLNAGFRALNKEKYGGRKVYEMLERSKEAR